LDSAEYALQLIRFPYRQVFGDPENAVTITQVFRASIAYQTYVAAQFVTGGH
jgi:hypothetical protein